MKNKLFVPVILMLMGLSSCQLIGDIFKTGVGVGMLLVIGILLLVVFVLARVFGSSK